MNALLLVVVGCGCSGDAGSNLSSFESAVSRDAPGVFRLCSGFGTEIEKYKNTTTTIDILVPCEGILLLP